MTAPETIETLWLQFGPMGDVESVSNEPIVYHTPWVKRVDHLALIAAAFEAAARADSFANNHETTPKQRMACISVASAIRALTPPDAQAALQAMIDVAVKEAREKDAAKIAALEREVKAACGSSDIYKAEFHAALELAVPDDGRPCNTDVFLAAVLDQLEDKHDVHDALAEWVVGDWDKAMVGVTLPSLAKIGGAVKEAIQAKELNHVES